ncbi:DUF1002 domain-containing protein [Streptococcus pseudopneumoniae]|uniref:DUF1002 domain-containing protein n=1 Tax=Streptococcus pseudopneumoniae TaxID=257758 RepID=UPI00110C377D|nr:DUF1002 domain-containing protein [Streptococcus pseudopneumoniae]NIB89076.1 DUF1002 domain-containing protein [Streptococcus pseudopneumoniae]TMR51976.1 DUF1002 domain-containing protein [Streptococcus pseudopneumoniae]TMR80004.1 DUF1002 domain-containing protein [Streptococcus pseudopneumoniae]TMR80791.1 DUF1002 domain-containing protein [Streptococcus pseudopneumoniae]
MRKKLFLTSAAVLWAVTAINSAHAATDVQKVIDETYVQPEYVLGSSLSEDQKNQTLKKLGHNASTDTKELKTMTPDVYSKIMNVANDSSLQLYSSAKIQKLGDKSPLEVKIETPENITKVTQDMYRNAAVTLGVEHAKITVAAPIPVTGESALAGIYYSLEANGAKVPQANKDLAQEELKALSDINAENKDKSAYDANKLNVALADIKSGLAKAKESKGNLTEEDVRKIVEDTLKNYKLDQVITGNQINIIINFALNLSKSDILSNADFTKTLNDLKQSIVSQAGDSFKNINLNFDADKALEDGGNFLSSLWQTLVNFFKSFGS